MNTIYDNTFTIGQTSAINFEAGPGISITEPTAGTVRIGADETVLWSDTINGLTSGSLVLNEPWSGFEKIRLDVVDQYGWGGSCRIFDTTNLAGARGKHFDCTYSFTVTGSPNTAYIRGIQLEFANGQYISGTSVGLESKFIPTSTIACTTTSGGAKLIKVIGINRISGSNA